MYKVGSLFLFSVLFRFIVLFFLFGMERRVATQQPKKKKRQ